MFYSYGSGVTNQNHIHAKQMILKFKVVCNSSKPVRYFA